MKKIAILGSSGGNLYNLGGKEPLKLLGEIETQCKSAGIEVEEIQFIGAKASMDNINKDTPTRLYTWDLSQNKITFSEEKSLWEINTISEEKDMVIAEKISSGEIDGLILMSSDPKNTNKYSIKAAIDKKIPIVGTGGTSMATIQSLGGNVIATSGTTGTTNRTRAVASVQALSKYWGIKYKPTIGGSSSSTSSTDDNILQRISFRGIMMSALPGFIAMALVLALSKVPAFSSLGEIFNILIQGLPVIVAAIAAKQVSGLDEVGIVAGVIAGMLSSKGGLIGGLIGGILAGILAIYLIRLALSWNFPGTTANIVSGGLSGLIAGLIVYFLISPITLMLGNGIRSIIETAVNFSPILAGAVAGLLIWPAIIGGVYHAAILPIVLLEMETTGASFLGAVDMTGLVMVSAGITLANILFPKQKSEAAIAAPGFFINIAFGTFVEASYPFMFSDKLVFIGAIISAALSGISVGIFNVHGTAYVPSITAPALSNNPFGFLVSMLVGLCSAFIITVIANKINKSKFNKEA
ncbi:Phosphotransferase system IIC components, glucose/maltose/N-acetylglucosamine-specific [Tissierella praeacuta DSM 18095]|uniref:Phosphotransferase system IIC components, glucose/maltose/N-acetylglucosamine-specific n=1 Tax=Tissierella praeacuta DSM 18095 TaxID=1123404 RepID=A0A1M4TMZ1_9FIRM|nr:PTS sugar transporter [Tissierella praeacuta]SHE45840.1 Phosphotransferase system IIC components, glucose/maltose/N-acetylglucosamine-specific [Tissierella praeacuta DSM 18095]SUP04479.1 PTS system, beta-glucoside-specific IIABC component [Tissierella praeacuta]